MAKTLLLDSIADFESEFAKLESGHEEPLVAVCGTHGGLYPAALASAYGLHGVILNDAGMGYRDSGVAGVMQLDEVGMAAAAADVHSCLIGSATEMYDRGTISIANNTAKACGVKSGMLVSDAAVLMAEANAPTAFTTIEETGARVVLLDSAALVNSSHIDQWVITGSHAALVGGNSTRALGAAASLAVFNDAGIATDNAGTARLPALAERNIAAVSIDHNSAIIGDAASTFEHGTLSAINRVAEHKGASCGVKLRDWLATLAPPADYTLAQMDDNWRAVHGATLLFVLDGTNVLLIRKKRGLGAGKINGPGGKIDPGESAEQCAIREVNEELQINPSEPKARGELRFQFTDGYSIHVHVFVAYNYSGLPQETDEAVPLWFPVEEIPYDEMWEDDRHWLPQVLNGQEVNGRFIFEGDRMLEKELNFRHRR